MGSIEVSTMIPLPPPLLCSHEIQGHVADDNEWTTTITTDEDNLACQ